MTQPQTLTSNQLQSYADRINAGGLDAAKQVYAELYALGYNYAGWAQGVATGQTLTGVSALDYLTGTALMGLGGPACRNLSDAQIDKIRLDMAQGYVQTLQVIATNNGNLLDRDVDYKETKDFHRTGFEKNGLTLDNWTLNTPMELLRQAQGDAAVEAAWTKMRDTGGDGLDGVLESAKLLKSIKDVADAGNAQAKDWVNNIVGDSLWGAIGKGLDAIKKWAGNNLPNGNPFSGADPFTGLPWPGGNDALITELQNLFDQAQTTVSPIVLDLDGDGVETTALSKSMTGGTHFNLDAKGLAENTGWVGKDDGLLVRDLDGDSQITSGRELFGNHTLLTQGTHAGQEAANGFEALQELDSNADGVVDAKDAAFATLRIWKDANGNGLTDAGELLTLVQAGVRSLRVTYTDNPNANADAQGNQHRQLGGFTKLDGSTQQMDDVWFAVDTARSQESDLVTVSNTIAALPDFAHIGNLHSLHQAMARDTSGQLQALVQRYEREALSPTRNALLQDILYHWAGVQDVDPASRAATQIYGNAIGDARKLVFLETLVGHDYLGTWCWGERDPNPHAPAAAKLLALYETVKTFYGTQLDAQTLCQDDLATLRLSWDEGTQSFGWDACSIVSQQNRSCNDMQWECAA
jgi:hypothetical protein